MKYKSILLGMLMMPLAAFGDSMCVPQMPSTSVTYTYVKSLSADNNRGYWGISAVTTSGDCRASSGTGVGDYEVVCDHPIVYGESHCSASGTLYPTNTSDWEKNGRYCWCRITELRTPDVGPNGEYIMAPKVGAWVFFSVLSNSSYCAAYCALNCASYARSYGGFRRALFASQGS